MPDHKIRHRFETLKPAILARSNPGMSQERLAISIQRERDRKMVRALALAFQRGDHLPKGVERHG